MYICIFITNSTKIVFLYLYIKWRFNTKLFSNTTTLQLPLRKRNVCMFAVFLKNRQGLEIPTCKYCYFLVFLRIYHMLRIHCRNSLLLSLCSSQNCIWRFFMWYCSFIVLLFTWVSFPNLKKFIIVQTCIFWKKKHTFSCISGKLIA